MGTQLSNGLSEGATAEGTVRFVAIQGGTIGPPEQGAGASHTAGASPTGIGECPGTKASGCGARRPGHIHPEAQRGVRKKQNVAKRGPRLGDASINHAASSFPEVGTTRSTLR
ncbi:hypothetical protein R1flu_021195 [Riccia fluitans]|uniref:Uncharacterized protein n=1 Tax=Riccia fluitans TaxID=41844 RepID=A0ABD1ZP71_9MARC